MPYFQSLRNVFGVDNTVTPAELKKAYRNVSKKYHPDLHPGKESEEMMKKITNAYEILNDPKKSKGYEKDQREKVRVAQKAAAKKCQVAKNRKNKKKNKKNKKKK